NANSSAIGTVTTAARTRITSHVIRTGAGDAANSAAIPLTAPVPAIRSSEIQRTKTIPPTTGATQPHFQLRLMYWRLKSNSVPAAATNRSGYIHSKPPEPARETIAAASIAKAGT